MANTTFNGTVRSTDGFQVITKSGGVETVIATLGTGLAPATMTAGTGITTGTGTVHIASVTRNGSRIETKILVDLTGLNCGGAAGDIIGVDATANCHIGQITDAVNGSIVGGYLECLVAPTTGDPDIDIWSADEATGTEDAAITGLTGEVQLVNSGDLSLGSRHILTGVPVSGQYLYAVCGTATAGTYDAGKFELTLIGQAV
jgi:hypothetical protein